MYHAKDGLIQILDMLDLDEKKKKRPAGNQQAKCLSSVLSDEVYRDVVLES